MNLTECTGALDYIRFCGITISHPPIFSAGGSRVRRGLCLCLKNKGYNIVTHIPSYRGSDLYWTPWVQWMYSDKLPPCHDSHLTTLTMTGLNITVYLIPILCCHREEAEGCC